MPTAHILYWNIENFTDTKIATNTRKRSRQDMEYGTGPSGPQHLRMILNTLGNTQDPNTGNAQELDFIVVVEIYARSGGPVEGQLVGGSGRNGCLNLLRRIRQNLVGNWGLVPPVVTGVDGFREAVAVYYRTDRWYFLGPQTWPNNYPQNLRSKIPNRNIPAGYPYRGGQPERLSAGQWQFGTWLPGQNPDLDNNQHVRFPAANNRNPWLTAFGRLNDNTLLVRLMSMHTSPNRHNNNLADQGTENLADVYDITARPADAAQQIDVVLGDFNVDNLIQANFQAGGPFGRLLGQGGNPANPAYSVLLRPPNGLNAQYDSYYHTHGRRAATILDDFDQPAGHYPGYRYTDESLDNALVRYQGIATPTHRMTILNRVDETPYDDPNPVPNPQPQRGFYDNVDWMDNSVDDIIAMAPDPYEDLNEFFRSWGNYGLVRSVSDHFALMFRI